MKNKLKITPEITNEYTFELYGEEFLIKKAHILNRHYIIIKEENPKLINYISKKFQKSQTYRLFYGIIFKTPHEYLFYKYQKGVTTPDLITKKLITHLKKQG